MTKMKWYRVRFDTKVNRHEYGHVVDVEAEDAQQARAIIEDEWHNKRRQRSHMFHISVKRLPKDADNICTRIMSDTIRW